jgi:hypothetical protein
LADGIDIIEGRTNEEKRRRTKNVLFTFSPVLFKE